MPIVVVTVLFVLAAFLTWYGTWFGHRLDEKDIGRFLSEDKNPSHVQHALLQVEDDIEKHDPGARRWYSQVAALKDSPTTEIRKTAAWVMGNDNTSEEFHEALRYLAKDKEPTVRWNASVQLARFNDNSGRSELESLLKPYIVSSLSEGIVTNEARIGDPVREGTLLARIVGNDQQATEMRSPLPGKIDRVLQPNGNRVEPQTGLFSVTPEETFVYEGLRAHVLIGEPRDIPDIQPFVSGERLVSNRVRQQAALTIKSIRDRASSTR